MFTGLIQETSKIMESAPRGEGLLLKLARPAGWNDLVLGESISVDGVCLTLTASDSESMEFFIGAETLSKSTLSRKRNESVVNLERSLRVGDRLGGHMVSGHADGVARVLAARRDGECLWARFQVTPQQYKWIITKGSIALNGVSLTVNGMDRDLKAIDVYLIPETMARTNLGTLEVGDEVNVECDQTVKIIAQHLSNYGVSHEQHS